MARDKRAVSVHPSDPLNSYAEPSFRGWLITAVVIIVVFAGLWLAYGAALNNPDLQRELDGREQIQGEPFPPGGAPQPGDG
jgi:hypothetical protein